MTNPALIPITFFTLRPNSGAGFVERFESLTAFNESRNGSEDRRKLRAFPYYALQLEYVFSTNTERLAKASIENSNGGKFELPLYLHPVQGIGTATPRLDAAFSLDLPASTFTPARRDIELFVVFKDGSTSRLVYGITQDGLIVRRQPSLGDTTLFGTTVAVAYPILRGASIEGDGFRTSMLSKGVFTGQVSFFSRSLDEGDRYTGLVQSGLPVFPTPAIPSLHGTSHRDGAAALQSNYILRFDREDAGHLPIESWLYTKRSISGTFRTLTRADSVALRLFLMRLHGRFQAFLFPDPVDGTLRKWRLASDTVELTWLTTEAMETNLTFIELP